VIQEIVNRKNLPALTSDHWHVVHARWSGNAAGKPTFVRSIVSEHEDRAAAVVAARGVMTSIVPTMGDRDPAGRDQVFVRKPDFKSLKIARRVTKRRR
jgi:hypothetical protein